MSDLVGNPEDRFSHNEAQIILVCIDVAICYPVHYAESQLPLALAQCYSSVEKRIYRKSYVMLYNINYISLYDTAYISYFDRFSIEIYIINIDQVPVPIADKILSDK